MAHITTEEKVPVGLGTQVGYGTGLVAFILAVISYFTGSGGDEDTINTIVTGAIALGMTGITTLGRQLQAAAAKKGVNVSDLPVSVDVDKAEVERIVREKMTDVLHDFDDRRHAAVEGEPGAVFSPDPVSPVDDRPLTQRTLEG